MRKAIPLIMVLLLAACATLQKPETNAQRLAYIDSQFTAIVKESTRLREQGVISDEQAERLTPVINKGNNALDAAWTALAQDKPESALEYVQIANNMLIELSRRMESSNE